MVATKIKFPTFVDGTLNVHAWLEYIKIASGLKNPQCIQDATLLAEKFLKGLTTFYGQPCIEQSLEIAEIMLDMRLDAEAVTAGMLFPTLQHTNISLDTIKETAGENVVKLLTGVQQIDILDGLKFKSRNEIQIDRLRKTYLAMVSDLRVALIKLAMQLCIMRGIKKINPSERARIGQETLDIYAPLANRLGIGQIKWELEDLAFHYIDPITYKQIAEFLAERRIDREERIQAVISVLKEELKKHGIKAKISGRAKHIYSIYLKMQKKELDYQNIYDASAVRLLVPTLEDCYTALSIVHQLWEQIPQEFDDYIANPKPNGYSSIHTAVIGPGNKNLEIQIRTLEMHEKAEHGFAAHWVYKENKPQDSGYEAKITFLRQLLSWHKQLAEKDPSTDKSFNAIFEDRVYVFTPADDIIDLQKGATPLDFAYHIHSGLGHRCRGAKINGHIVPLTYTLQTGDKVEIITTSAGTPSRDWLNKEAGYLKTNRARSKVLHWFRQLDLTQYIEAAKHTLEKEFSRHGIHPDLNKIAQQFNFKNSESLLSALGHGSIRAAQIVNAALTENQSKKTVEEFQPYTATPMKEVEGGFHISGLEDLLTRIGKCCKPIPGDPIIGFITQGRGVTIHRQNCNNIRSLTDSNQTRLINVSWDKKHSSHYYIDLDIEAHDRQGLIKDITIILSNERIDLISIQSTINKKNNLAYIKLTLQILNNEQLKILLQKIKQISDIIQIKRAST